MKGFLFLGIWFLASGVAVAGIVQQTCKLSTEKGPFETLAFEYRTDGKKLTSNKLTVIFTYSDDAGAEDAKEVTVKDVPFTSEKAGLQVLRFKFDHNDWQGTNIELGEDDDGVAAFVRFTSEGPTLRSFYRCAEFPAPLKAKYVETLMVGVSKENINMRKY